MEIFFLGCYGEEREHSRKLGGREHLGHSVFYSWRSKRVLGDREGRS